MDVDVVVMGGGGLEQGRIELMRDGRWKEGITGRFTFEVEEDWPVNGLVMAISKEGEDPRTFGALASALDHRPQGCVALVVKKEGQDETIIPVRSVEHGLRTLSLYRQSGHQDIHGGCRA